MEFAIAFKCDCGCETTVSGEYKELGFYLLVCEECRHTIKFKWETFMIKAPHSNAIKIPTIELEESD